MVHREILHDLHQLLIYRVYELPTFLLQEFRHANDDFQNEIFNVKRPSHTDAADS
jgi:hypothetical protein